MAEKISAVNVAVNQKSIAEKLDAVIHNDKVMLEVHNAFARNCNDYVPMQEGTLAQTTTITKDYVQYNQPYAHYQYVGEVYGPNIPIKDEDGDIEGWFSPPGKKKHPTGRPIQYNKEMHPKASKEWDKAMMADRGKQFMQEVKEILVRRAHELYG